MVEKERCLVSFEFGKFNQHFEIEQGHFNIGEELVKFVCYIEDHNMIEYFQNLIRLKQFTFNESFFIFDLTKKTIVNDLNKEDVKKNFYKWHYIVDLDCEYLCFITYVDHLIKYDAVPFEQISEYPYQWEMLI
ncbi:MAG: hypothetical protein RBS24_07100 [Bacilli bacterium]|nr:hypothetical protein [Bacilli bacterium]